MVLAFLPCLADNTYITRSSFCVKNLFQKTFVRFYRTFVRPNIGLIMLFTTIAIRQKIGEQISPLPLALGCVAVHSVQAAVAQVPAVSVPEGCVIGEFHKALASLVLVVATCVNLDKLLAAAIGAVSVCNVDDGVVNHVGSFRLVALPDMYITTS